MKQLTCVGFYGHQKTRKFQQYLKSLQTEVDSLLGNDFKPYDIRQIHGTIIGMEKLIGYRKDANYNIWDIKEKIELMKFKTFLKIIKDWDYPIKIRFGGFSKEYNEFISCPKSGLQRLEPYYRSFSINVRMGKVVLIGWPHKNNDFKNNLELLKLRSEIKTKANIIHKYDHWEDNDFFVVLGDITNKLYWQEAKNAGKIDALNQKIRDDMCKNVNDRMLDLDLTQNDIYLVQYTQESLELNSSEAYNIVSYKYKIRIEDLYC